MLKKTAFLFFVFCFTATIIPTPAFSQTVSSTNRSTQTDKQKVAVVIPSEEIDENISLIQGTVIVVYDGDTISVQSTDGKIYAIRMQGIDAPEGKQNYGDRSQKSLSDLIFDKNVIVVIDKKDLYDRYIGNVYYDGQDVSLLQIKSGMAWYFKKYSEDQTAENRKRYAQTESDARSSRIGLWQEEEPTPPWEFRGEVTGNSDNAVEGDIKPAKSDKSKKKKGDREYIKGPRGGCYYINSSGTKTYVKDKSLCDN
jgi:endonuclease YncB( thermonuclease family)